MKRWEHFVFLSAIILVVLFNVLYFGTKQTPLTEHEPSLNWIPFKNQPVSATGFLLELRNKETNLSIYIASDQELDQEDYVIAPSWEIATRSQEDIWNPRVCAQVPTTITDQGDIFMLQGYKDENLETHYRFIWFQNASNKTIESDAEPFDYLADSLFAHNGSEPLFFGVTDQNLYAYSFNPHSQLFTKKRAYDAVSDEAFSIKKDLDGSPVIAIYDSETLNTSNFSFSTKSLQPFTGTISRGNMEVYDETQQIFNLGNGVRAKYLVDTPYKTSVLYGDETVLSFIGSAKIYSYIIGSYIPSQ